MYFLIYMTIVGAIAIIAIFGGLYMTKRGARNFNTFESCVGVVIAFSSIIILLAGITIPSMTKSGKESNEIKNNYEFYSSAITNSLVDKDTISPKLYSSIKEHNESVDNFEETFWTKVLEFKPEEYKFDLESYKVENTDENHDTSPDDSNKSDDIIEIDGKRYKLIEDDT